MQPQRIAGTLQQKHWLRVHGMCMGFMVLLVMWAASAIMLHQGVDSMALRYALSLGLGYVVYLLVLRLWVAHLVRNAHKPQSDDALGDLPVPDGVPSWQHDHASPNAASGGGGDFGGGGASGDWGGDLDIDVSAAADAGSALDLGGLDLGGADEGIIIVPILAVFAGLVAAFLGFGALLWLYFGVDVLLAVAVELAFAMMTARAVVRVERAGWLVSAIRLTWKPLLGALVCAVAFGALADWWVPDADTLREVIAHVRGKS